MKKLVADVLKLNEKLVRCEDYDHRDCLIAYIERLLDKATLKDLKAIYEEESHIAKYEWNHLELVNYYADLISDIELDATLSNEDM